MVRASSASLFARLKKYNISLIKYILFNFHQSFDSVKLFFMASEIGGVEKPIYSFRKRGFL